MKYTDHCKQLSVDYTTLQIDQITICQAKTVNAFGKRHAAKLHLLQCMNIFLVNSGTNQCTRTCTQGSTGIL